MVLARVVHGIKEKEMTAEQLIEKLQKMIDSHSISPSAKIVYEEDVCVGTFESVRTIDLTIDESYMTRNTVIFEEERK